jgi:hypothetical protein
MKNSAPETEKQVLLTLDSRGRVTLPAAIFKHRKYEVEELGDGTLILTPVPGSEY